MTNIKVDNPCPFLLIRMEKEGNNYFCKSCSKTIVDLWNNTEEEIRMISRKDTCGVFTHEQIKGHQQKNIFRQTLFYFLTILSFFAVNVKPLTAQTIETIKIKTDSAAVNFKSKSKANESLNTKKIDNFTDKKEKKRKIFRRKKKRPVIGCPSF